MAAPPTRSGATRQRSGVRRPAAAGAARGPGGPGRAVRAVVTHPWPVLLAAGVVIFAIWAIGTREVPHQVRAIFGEAPDLYSGEDVEVDGLDAGKVTTITYADGDAVVGVGIQDSQYWPLHQGTTVTLRYGTTVGNGTRYLQLDPGPSSAPAIPENGLITQAHTVDAVEFDQVFGTFNGPTRKAFRAALAGTGATFAPRTRQLGAAVAATGPGLAAVANLTGALSEDQQDLNSLVSSGAALTSDLASRSTSIQDLVSNAAGTFHAFADNTPGITGSLDRTPATLIQMRTTLARLDVSLGHLSGLVTALKPGAAQLGTLSADLLPAMSNLRSTIPVADATFAVATKAAPRITSLLKVAQPFSTTAAPALTNLAPMVACIRPYSPEIAGLLTTWSSFTQPYEPGTHLGRLLPMGGVTSLTSSPETPAELVALTGTTYALVHPPGYNDGHPEFLPQCDAGPNMLNPADDPEVGQP